jgi:hypothetical protein
VTVRPDVQVAGGAKVSLNDLALLKKWIEVTVM